MYIHAYDIYMIKHTFRDDVNVLQEHIVPSRTLTHTHTHTNIHIYTRKVPLLLESSDLFDMLRQTLRTAVTVLEQLVAHTDTQKHRHTDTQIHRHTDTQTHRHTDTQTHRRTDTQTHKHTDT